MIDDVLGLVDMMQSAIPKSARRGLIFFPGNVVMSSREQLHRAVVAARPVHAHIDRRMVVQVLAIIDRSSLNLVDGFVDLFNGVLFFPLHVMRWSQVFQVCAGVPQVSERMQVSWMPSRFFGESYGGAQSDKKYDDGAVSCSFHSVEGLSEKRVSYRLVKSKPNVLNSPNSIRLSAIGESYCSTRVRPSRLSAFPGP